MVLSLFYHPSFSLQACSSTFETRPASAASNQSLKRRDPHSTSLLSSDRPLTCPAQSAPSGTGRYVTPGNGRHVTAGCHGRDRTTCHGSMSHQIHDWDTAARGRYRTAENGRHVSQSGSHSKDRTGARQLQDGRSQQRQDSLGHVMYMTVRHGRGGGSRLGLLQGGGISRMAQVTGMQYVMVNIGG